MGNYITEIKDTQHCEVKIYLAQFFVLLSFKNRESRGSSGLITYVLPQDSHDRRNQLIQVVLWAPQTHTHVHTLNKCNFF